MNQPYLCRLCGCELTLIIKPNMTTNRYVCPTKITISHPDSNFPDIKSHYICWNQIGSELPQEERFYIEDMHVEITRPIPFDYTNYHPSFGVSVAKVVSFVYVQTFPDQKNFGETVTDELFERLFKTNDATIFDGKTESQILKKIRIYQTFQ